MSLNDSLTVEDWRMIANLEQIATIKDILDNKNVHEWLMNRCLL